ncbi:energy-coupled thiamine transporter ThiT [Peribacillus sp. NJ4]|nr:MULTISPECIES: energy-coupled thiamine transporter ThiT [unclassified Peribacillus]MDM5213930.1 energy-coupled thiamine transporter ThiT [Peribacillus sp. NJ4]MDM5219242.1 energy-coupled thiamine transporter ThiT [Peribacillus sp. NJ11]MDM5357473.1 energy-coupled thiamine transporter ThiT [Peribacillus sp. ACCC06369]
MMKNKTLFMTEVAIFASLALLLDMVSGFIFSRIWPQGGSISIAMVPIFLMAYRWGIKGGMLAGLLLGLLQIVSGTAWIGTPIQGFIDYYLAFMVVGISGVFMNKFVNSYKEEKRSKAKLYGIGGMFLGSFLRFLCHFTSGIVFFGSAAPKGQPVAVYSFIYNGTYMLISFILSAIVVMMLYSAASNVLLKKAY